MILLAFGGSKCSDAKTKIAKKELYEVPHKQTYVDTTISKM